MSEYYNAKRSRNVYDPEDTKSFKISRSKIDLFLECPRCFYLDRRLGVGRPPGFPFTINSAIDFLLKKEFDIHRAKGTKHPLIERYNVDATPVAHENLDEWRENFKGIQFHHKPTNFIITGAIDDLWQDSKGNYIVVDYKATSKTGRITELDKDWHRGYKRQMEIYQWLLRQNGYTVSNTGYFVYCNGKTDSKAFDGKIEFDITLIAYEGNDSWIEDALGDLHGCLSSDDTPPAGEACDYCAYTEARKEME